MSREQSIVGRYYRMSPKQRIDLIITNYDCFPAMCKDYERDLTEWLKAAKAKARRDAIGDLGVRIQSGNSRFSVTEMHALENMEIEQMLQDGNLDSCENLEDYEDILRGLMELHLMRKEYRDLRSKISTLHTKDRVPFEKYISHNGRSIELSEDLNINFESVRKRMYRIKKKVYAGLIDSLADYDDDSILLFLEGGAVND